jgi:ribosomal-protein-alanine N-acetyltransferase
MTPLPRDRFPSVAGSTVRQASGERRLQIRAATAEDLPHIVRLDAEAFPADPYPYFVLRQFLDGFPHFVFVLEDHAGLVGYVLSTPPDEAHSWILSLGIAPGLRGQGLGRRLMQEILGHLRKKGVHSVSLSVEPGNDSAVALYDSLGFVPDPGGPHLDYFGPGAHRLLMRLSL